MFTVAITRHELTLQSISLTLARWVRVRGDGPIPETRCVADMHPRRLIAGSLRRDPNAKVIPLRGNAFRGPDSHSYLAGALWAGNQMLTVRLDAMPSATNWVPTGPSIRLAAPLPG